MAFLTREEMAARVPDALTPWVLRVLATMVNADDPTPLDMIIDGAMAEQERYRLTPGHPEQLTEAEVQQCICVGIKAPMSRFYNVLSPVDRPGLQGPMPLGELLAAAKGMVFSQRAFAGMDKEPNPPRPATPPVTGPYPWSMPPWIGR